MKTGKSFLLSILFLFLLLQIPAYTQNNFTLGVKGGLIFNQYIIYADNLNSEGSDFRNGPAMGITSQLFKSKSFMLMGELYYLKRGVGYGVHYYYPYTTGGKTSVSSLSFLVMPSYRYENKYITPFVFAGPRIEKVLNSDEAEITGFYKQLNSYNFGITSGIGIEKSISQHISITAEFRYSHDLTGFTFAYSGIGNELMSADYYNSSFDILLGINCNLSKPKGI